MRVLSAHQAKLQEKTGLASIIKESQAQGQFAADAVMTDDGKEARLDEDDAGSEGHPDQEDVDVALDGAPAADDPAKRKAGGSLNGPAKRAKRNQTKQEESKQVKGSVYSLEEARKFSKEIQCTANVPGSVKEEKRLKCAADDIICCVNFIFHEEFTEYDRDTSINAILRAKSLCYSLWVEFLLSGQVSLNGKKFKAYSGLRPELQHVARLAREKITVQQTGEKKDPMEIAKELTKELLETPVTMVIEGDDDVRTRIAKFMQKTEQVASLRKFADDTLDLPVAMHEAVVNSLKMAVGKTMDLVDFITQMEKNVSLHLPAQWLAFATDVSDYYAQNGGFAAGCEQAGVCCFLCLWVVLYSDWPVMLHVGSC